MEKEQTNENSWEFHLTDKIAQLSKMTLEMHTEFWLSTLQTMVSWLSNTRRV